MLKKLLTEKRKVRITWIMLCIIAGELVLPNVSYALSSGPVQPEITSFEPVGTTDMVDLFTGDFVYNIPLMDVEGYPINIAYHGGVTMDQEASWVGLGWNITPGAINRGIRGLPDEFAGDTIEKEMNIKPEITKKIGAEAGIELAGLGKPILNIGLGLGGYVTISNYRGIGVDLTTSAGVNTDFKFISAGVNIGASVGSQSGAAIDYSASVGVGISRSVSNDMSASGGFNVGLSGVYSPRTAHRTNLGVSVGAGIKQASTGSHANFSTGANVPIGLLQNFTSVLTNPCYMNSYTGQLKLGGEVYSVYLNAKVNGSYSEIKYESNGSRKGYGYYNLDKSTENDILDFSREKDGNYNKTMGMLPQSHITYDVYNVSGQGTGGSFRPYRNDIGSVFDPYTKNPEGNSDNGTLEVGLGNLFEVGGEYTNAKTNVESGPWDDYKRKFSKDTTGYSEPLYFKEAGELTQNNEAYMDAFGKDDIVKPDDVSNIPLTKPGAGTRVIRANHIYTHNGYDYDTAALVDSKTLVSYTSTNGFASYPNISKVLIPRVDNNTANKLKRTPDQITEIVQNQKDGRRYVYGLPVVNNVQREVTFAVDQSKADKRKYLVDYTPGMEDSKSNTNGLDNFYSSSVTPTYVAAHLLTSVLSKDYVDVTGNGISDDDLGSYTKFNYTRKSSDYRWRSPIESGKAQYIPAYISDKKDDKASYVVGSREQWMLHSIETRNYVAEFYVSPREDAKGVKDKILNNGPVYKDAQYSANGADNDNQSYKLDSLVLYNKHDRFINGAAAQPIKAVLFSYNYSLCPGVPNATNAGGKLTLAKIRIRYGNSNLNLSAGYTFKYGSGSATDNPGYNPAEKDRWGFYKKNDTNCNNFEFPYTAQDPVTNDYAKAWSLSEVGLPSGGVIKVDYEADDYAYVQDKLAMEMFKVAGMGNSPSYQANANQLYFNINQQNLYFYFKRRRYAENANLTFRENYLNGTNIMYYNIPVELADGKFEPIKGYAEITEIGACNNDPNSDYGYVKLSPRRLEGSGDNVNPVVYTALNVGRYNLPHILFPGSDPDATDMDNVTKGLKDAIKEMWGIYKNPLGNMINQGKAQDVDLVKAYVRLTSPGLSKKGGGQRVKSVRFYDSWNSMTGGQQAIYGKQYDYTIPREDGKGAISSGVASYEPLIGGDELPQRVPSDTFQVQRGSNFPPNDPVELYSEGPICESFYPGPVVGYRRVTEHSINIDLGRSSQTEDVHSFYTAKDFPIRTRMSAIQKDGDGTPHVTIKSIDFSASAKQGFSVVLNDMHGKPSGIEHWVLKPTGVPGAKELVNSQQFDYVTKNGALDNTVPTFSYNGPDGQIGVVSHSMGIESDLTIDSRRREEETHKVEVSASVNGFLVAIIPIAIGLGFPYQLGNKLSFKSATVTKVTQQYGILNQVTNNNQGAITVVKNEVFDPQTGNALVTSVNNQYGDREYTVNYPAHWAYKELGPSYENQDLNGTFANPVTVDSLGPDYASRQVNYNYSFSTRYLLPSNMPVIRTIIDEEMPKFKLGDELLLEKTTVLGINSAPTRAWVMGFTSDVDHCYLILATRAPYSQSFYPIENNDAKVRYRVVRSGNRNRLGETIQGYTTTDASNVFPYLKDTLKNLITLNASTYKHNLNQVAAANTTSDSLNPFITGKVGLYRPELQVVNLKKRDYQGGTTRDAGTFNSAAYWKTEMDKMSGYCDSQISVCHCEIDSMRIVKTGNDDAKIVFYPSKDSACRTASYLSRNVFAVNYPILSTVIYDQSIAGNVDSFNYHFPNSFLSAPNPSNTFYLQLSTHSCKEWFYLSYDGTRFKIEKGPTGDNIPYISYDFFSNKSATSSSFKIRKKILLGKVGHYANADNENWRNAQQVTKYNAYGEELENLDPGVGYNSAIYGYNQQLPVCVAKNAKHGEVLYESFDDYDVLQPKPDKYESYMPLVYSPFASLFLPITYGGAYNKLRPSGTVVNGANTNRMARTNTEAHTGTYSLKIEPGSNSTYFGLNGTDKGMAKGYSFGMHKGEKYVVSIWAKSAAPTIKITADTTLSGFSSAYFEKTLTTKSPVIDGWQQYETEIDIPGTLDYKRFALLLSGDAYYDDVRIYPFRSNSKGFVYHPVTRKLMATLDENNYATFYEYDSEGNLVRTKKETDKGILTITESRSTHYKTSH